MNPCPNCGEPARPGAAFCTSCGSRLEPTPKSERTSRSPLLIVVAIAAAVILIGGGAVAILTSGRSSSDVRTVESPPAAAGRDVPSHSPPPSPSPSPALSPSPSAAPPPKPQPVSTLDVKTSAGVVRIQSISIRNLYMECPPPTNVCRDVTGAPYVIVTVVSSSGRGARQISDAILPQATESFVLDGRGRRADFETVRHTEGSSRVELIYAGLASMNLSVLVLHWEGNPPILLRV